MKFINNSMMISDIIVESSAFTKLYFVLCFKSAGTVYKHRTFMNNSMMISDSGAFSTCILLYYAGM